MSDLILQGLTVSAIGIGLTFAALMLLILVMVLLTRLFPARREIEETGRPVEPIQASASGLEAEEDEHVAAIAAALAYLRSQRTG